MASWPSLRKAEDSDDVIERICLKLLLVRANMDPMHCHPFHFHPHREPLVFLAILSPARLPDEQTAVPDPQDVSDQQPWASLRAGLPECRTLA
ncbi:MAG: hypothetical protein CJBNEKGG_03224 [Prosthecobacter sp.]|nr:hypothetical protein [Prosthecobacter sp.]